MILRAGSSCGIPLTVSAVRLHGSPGQSSGGPVGALFGSAPGVEIRVLSGGDRSCSVMQGFRGAVAVSCTVGGGELAEVGEAPPVGDPGDGDVAGIGPTQIVVGAR